MGEQQFVSLFKKAEISEKIEKKDYLFIVSCIYSVIAVIASFSIYYLKLNPFELMQQFGYFGNVSEMITVLGFMVLPILLPMFIFSLHTNKIKLKIISSILIATDLISRIAAILLYYVKVTGEREIELTPPTTATKITFFIFMLCIFVLLIGVVFYAVGNNKISAMVLKIGAISYIILSGIFFLGFMFMFIAKPESYLIYCAVVFLLDVISSIFILLFVKKLNNKIGNEYLENK
ncbi:MAG: hypothetical protein RR436_00905 [Clostridia bacterium]